MTTYRIKLVETLTTQGSVEFPIVAPNVEAAAAVVSDAYDSARKREIDVLTLPDGQSSMIEANEMVERATKLVLVDEQGADVQTIVPPERAEDPH